MFGHTQFSIGPQFPNHNIDGRKLASTKSRPQSPSAPKQVTRGTNLSPLSERYSNKSYNRVPSPVSRLQPRPASGTSSAREVSKPCGLSGSGFSNEGPSDNDKSPRLAGGVKNDQGSAGTRLGSPVSPARPRPLQDQCTLRSPIQPRPRPRTAGAQRDAELDDRVMVAVKEALSRAVLESGPIYEHNIDTILYDMRNRLRVADNGRSVPLNENTSSDTITSGKGQPSAAIVRKDLGDSVKPTLSSYKRVYGDGPKKSPNNRVIDKDPDSVVFIDLPDPDSSNFNFLLNSKRNQSNKCQNACDLNDVGNKYSKTVTTPEKINLQRELEEDTLQYAEESVGDGQPRKSRSFIIWKDSDDAKLQRYISKLINNMNNKLSGDSPTEGVDCGEETESVVCKAFCVCKVCLRNKEYKNEIKEPIRQTQKPLDNGLKSSIRLTSSIRPNIGKSKLIQKDSKASTNVRVLKKAENLVLDSKSTINSHGTLFSIPQTRYTPIPGMDEEANEEMYLKRRLRRLAPLKRN